MTDDALDPIFHALAHATRRAILDQLRARPGQGVGELAKGFDVSRIAIMNHLAVLESAGLLVSERDGRTRRLYLNAAPIRMIHDRWIDQYTAYWADRAVSIKAAAERAAQRKDEKE